MNRKRTNSVKKRRHLSANVLWIGFLGILILLGQISIAAENEEIFSESTNDELSSAVSQLKEEVNELKNEIKKKQDKSDPLGKFNCKVGGFLFMDALDVSQSQEHKDYYGDIDNKYFIRDARLSFKGEGYGFLQYEMTIGVNREELNFKDVKVVATRTPLFSELTVGYFKVESNMGFTSSIADQTFNDFDTNTYTFRAGRRMGVGSAHLSENKKARLFLGVYTGNDLEKDCAVSISDAAILLNARGTGTPIYRVDSEGNLDEVLHFGSAYYWEKPDQNLALRNRPSGWVYSMPYSVKGTLSFNGNDAFSVFEVESAWQKRGLGIQSEGFVGFYNGYDNAYGVNTQIRWMLTPGAYREYKQDKGCFGSVVVPEKIRLVDYQNRSYFEGYGALELASQWSYTNLDNLETIALTSAEARYGTINEIQSGVNWYWNPQTRLSFNWVHSMLDTGNNSADKENRVCDTFLSQIRITF